MLERSNQYRNYFKPEYMMGPNSLRLLDEIINQFSTVLPKADCERADYEKGNREKGSVTELRGRILDLGCGTGITSLFLAKETRAQIFAVDLWCSATENQNRMEAWGVGDKVIPLHADANDLPFAEEYFDAIVSIDSYHYFAREAAFFREKVLPFVKRGGQALIAIPGLKEEFGETAPKLMTDWAGEEWEYFHSPAWWKKTIGESEQIESVTVYEMESFDIAWEEWFATGAEYAVQDKKAFEKGLGEYLNFVGIAVKKS